MNTIDIGSLLAGVQKTQSIQKNKGVLYLVGTPIGNMFDITIRALAILQHVDCIATENSTKIFQLLQHYSIYHKKIINCHDDTAEIEKIIALLQDEQHVALVSDAGMPTISDPGNRLVQAALKNDISITAIPGPSAVTTAISLSKIPSGQWMFLGFISSATGGKIRSKLLEAHARGLPAVLFESPKRLLSTLLLIAEIWNPNTTTITICRELTKLYEEVFNGSVAEAIAKFSKQQIRGEITVVLDRDEIRQDLQNIKNIAAKLAARFKTKDIAHILQTVYNIERRQAYSIATESILDITNDNT